MQGYVKTILFIIKKCVEKESVGMVLNFKAAVFKAEVKMKITQPLSTVQTY